MEKCCETKVRVRQKSEREKLIKHLNRISGQINGIKQMVADSRYCDDILTQIAAATNSLKSLGVFILEEHMKTCVKERIVDGDEDIIDETLNTIRRLYR